MLVLEDPGGEPLQRLLWKACLWRWTGFLRRAIDIRVAVGGLHRQGLLRKDIKPANIMVNCADWQVRLKGGGIASRVPGEQRAPVPPRKLSPVHSAQAWRPEQTGRVNRSIDSRSDLYALGVAFYRMLTGSLPFTAANRFGVGALPYRQNVWIRPMNQQKRTQGRQGLHLDEQSLQILVETIPTLMWRAKPDGHIDYVNKRLLEYFGSPLEDIIGWGWLEKVHPDDVAFKVKSWLSNLETMTSHRRRSVDFKASTEHTDGSPYVVRPYAIVMAA